MTGPTWDIRVGDCRELLAGMPDESVATCVTSPPYFGLRDYGHDEQIGLEPTPEQFVSALVGVFREVRRVLRADGTLWLNLGDSYAGGGCGARDPERWPKQSRNDHMPTHAKARTGLKDKDLIGIPWMVAFALRADGWYLRSEVIWAKRNCMPENVLDRPTKAHEQIFLLSKRPRYFYDTYAIREESEQDEHNQAYAREYDVHSERAAGTGQPGNVNSVGIHSRPGPGGRNKRTVWTVSHQPYAGAHFATFPPKLIEPCILAGSPQEACAECGAPWQRVVERTPMRVRPTPKREAWQADDEHARTQTGGTMTQAPSARTVGFERSCGCDAPTVPGVVLDPFNGAGTTGMVALRHGRSYVGIELNPEYADLARFRIRDDSPLLNGAAELVPENDGKAA